MQHVLDATPATVVDVYVARPSAGPDRVAGCTATETAATRELVVDVVQERPVTGMHAETPSAHHLRLDADLDAGTAQALARARRAGPRRPRADRLGRSGGGAAPGA